MSRKRIAGEIAKNHAKLLRKKMTGTEQKLWGLLRNRRLKNEKFRRQYPIGSYIVDFYHAGQNLVIELDGESHNERGPQDIKRQQWLEAEGYRILRISNDDVIKEEENVLFAILKALGKPLPQ
ncbi:DUF559 domain-containing protein [Planctomycetaceae bacterium]|jgi:very-short-patch-repair endonuclease|nr:DUF559 domain-containing protein [Planctomycetaceae bacterium]MDC0273391.1 DUF559 domain-containing protein [Planctomycetaceae bacterium]MDC0307731.1 DUF559 domain-containing protein [Planctomycetaceae bacterium]MDG2389295.1 DUF559 domain-containing protein [Planctomycetaceae bacterium]